MYHTIMDGAANAKREEAMNITRWQIDTTIVAAITPREAIRRLREQRNQLDPYYDYLYEILRTEPPHIILVK